MATTKYQGTGVIASSDYKDVKWVGKTKGGKSCTITLQNAINLGNLDWAFAEKDDTVAEIVMTATYDNTDEMSDETTEPYTIEIDSTETGAATIMLGVGVFTIGETVVALTRGGGKFTVEREFREINADGDRGPVKDRIVMESSRATLTLNTLQVLADLTGLYPAMGTVTQS